MTKDKRTSLEKLSQPELASFTLEVLRRTLLHYGFWFNEVQHQLGLEEASRTEQDVAAKIFPITIKRLSKTLGFEMKGDLPAFLADMPREKLIALIDAMAVNWLASDGVWFQAVESLHDMNTAKRANDTCWTRFSPLEAGNIMSFLNIPEKPGLDGLATALNFRLYARINKQSIEKEDDCLILRMVDCRVQGVRKSKGMADYPCKSAGLVEYAAFARAIDPKIKTECLACPPDKHPEEWFCAWRFYLPA